MATEPGPTAVVLAAGAGTRLGGVAKALLVRDGATFLARIVGTVRALGGDAIVVVGPPFGDEVARHARELGAEVVVNPDPARGMASSIALGFAALRAGDAAWLWPVDHPAVTATTLRTLVAAIGSHAAARPTYQGRGGHPPLIARSLWGELAACAQSSARVVLAAADMIDVAVDDPGCVRDIDTPAELEAAR